ncbi:MAG TPA: hypothetical protein VGR06_14890 [Actinophytocola sp.]|jgi:hypothetical protein|uniref:hypothetical protein n=1 Tax=Actinophytocola sp. TaxID=1872138 RepID=UPI002E00351B|nr:hypothetical protein [Actinophytocola sp.]
MRITRIAAAGLAVAAVSLAGAVPAGAQPSAPPPSGSVTITLSPEQVAFLCDKRLPRMETRVTKLIDRINGGADVKGSTAWLKDRAAKERAAGRETSAKLLEERAERRAGRIDELNKIKGWVTDFRGKYCGAK